MSDKKRASPSVDARGASRSPSDGMRLCPLDVLRVIRGRFSGSGETRATELPKPSAALFAQVLLATNCTPARASLRDSLSLGGYALGFPPWAGVSPSPCAAHLPSTTLLWLKSGRVRKDKRRGKSAAAEKWLKRQLEFRDEQRIPGAVGRGNDPA